MCNEKVDVIVNAANGKLAHIGGLALAISNKGGSIVDEESAKIIQGLKQKTGKGRVPTGECVHTSAGKLPCKYKNRINYACSKCSFCAPVFFEPPKKTTSKR